MSDLTCTRDEATNLGLTLMSINGVEYASRLSLVHEIDGGKLFIRAVPRVVQIQNSCECCGRGDISEVVCTSWQEVINRHWVARVVDEVSDG